MENNLQKTLQTFLEESSPEQLREELKKGNRPFFQTMKNNIPFTEENFDKLLMHNTEMFNALQVIINGCVHPDTAVRAVMVDLTPIRKILKKNTEFINKIKLQSEEPTKMYWTKGIVTNKCPICGVELSGCHIADFCSKENGGCGKYCDGYVTLTEKEAEQYKELIIIR
jgi:hypothetical protein